MLKLSLLKLPVLLIPFSITMSVEAGGFRLEPESGYASKVGPAPMVRMKKFLDEVENRLPKALKDAIGQPITVRFSQLDEKSVKPRSSLDVPGCPDVRKELEALERKIGLVGDESEAEPASPKQAPSIFGQTKSAGSRKKLVVELNNLFVWEVFNDESRTRKFSCGHKNLYRLAVATALHEIGHIYDRLPRKEGDGAISDSRAFASLMEWDSGIFTQEAKNKNRLGSPDPYEFKSLEESFAVNLEYFLMDSEFRCRRPDLYDYYSGLMGEPPVRDRAASCTVNTKAFLSVLHLPIEINPDRVYEIHYLLASKGPDLPSRWGHSMFRIIACAPERPEVSAECLKDISHHIVVSYRANISDTKFDAWDAVIGKLPSQLFLYTMSEIMLEYNQGEFRDLLSIPIRLSRDDVRRFIHRTLVQYWGYIGSYAFLGNNCSTESLDFLKSVALSSPAVQDLEEGLISTPAGLYDELIEQRLSDRSIVEGESAIGVYRFPSLLKQVKKAYKRLLKSPGFPVDIDLDTYLTTLRPEARREIYDTVVAAAKKTELSIIAADFSTIELAIRSNLRAKLEKRAMALLDSALKGDLKLKDLSPAQIRKMGKELVEKLNLLLKVTLRLTPYFLPQGSYYGIPLEGELPSDAELAPTIIEAQALTRKLMKLFEKAEGKTLWKIRETSANIQKFMADLNPTAEIVHNLQPQQYER